MFTQETVEERELVPRYSYLHMHCRECKSLGCGGLEFGLSTGAEQNKESRTRYNGISPFHFEGVDTLGGALSRIL
jgi:hypothetical protein